MCGADCLLQVMFTRLLGSSPRVRSGPGYLPVQPYVAGIISACAERTSSRHIVWRLFFRIISACAERTSPAPPSARSTGDHLRVCGADFGTARGGGTHEGSSPRVRSGPQSKEA